MPEFPHELAYIWQWHQDLCAAQPLTYSELNAWSNLSGVRLLPWELDLLRSLDRIFWKVRNE